MRLPRGATSKLFFKMLKDLGGGLHSRELYATLSEIRGLK